MSQFRKFKIADGRHIVNRKITICQRKTILFLRNFVHNNTFGTRWQSRDQILLKFKMADVRHIKNRFWPQLSSRLPYCSEILCDEAVFPQNFSYERWTYICVLNSVSDSTSGAFHIVSDTLIWRWIISWPWYLDQWSLKVIQTGIIRKLGYTSHITLHHKSYSAQSYRLKIDRLCITMSM